MTDKTTVTLKQKDRKETKSEITKLNTECKAPSDLHGGRNEEEKKKREKVK